MASEGPDSNARGFDPLMPVEVARKAELVGAQKTRMETGNLFVLSLLGGAFIAFGAVFATTVSAGIGGVLPYGITRLLIGPVFCLGLVLIVIGGAELFTGNALMVMALASRKVTLREMLRAWLIVFAGNLIGALGTAALVFLSGQYRFGGASVGKAALDLAITKVNLPFDQAFFLAVLCNLLVCLAVWMSYAARSVVDKLVVVVLPISAFVAAGFEHSVANMYFIPMGLLIKQFAPVELWAQLGMTAGSVASLTWPAFLMSLIPVTIGNIVGGAVLVGAVYWFVYSRPQLPERATPGTAKLRRVGSDSAP
jgi:formate/nitrite transporter